MLNTLTGRDELLAEIKAERAERGEARKRAQAAISIQRNWRGHCARNQVRDLLTAQCLERLSSAQSSPLTAQEIAGFLLPRLLFLLLPSAPAAAAAAAGAYSHAPPSAPVQPTTPAPDAGGDASRAAPGGCGGGGAAAAQLKLIRGSLAALIYSLSSPRPENNYAALPHGSFNSQQEQEEGQQQQQQREQEQGQQQLQNLQHQHPQQLWWRQCARLQHLCCVLVGRGDAVVDAAAVRILALLTDHTQNKLAINQEAKARIAASLLQQVTRHQYTPLFQALGRVLASKAVVGSGGQSADASSTRPASKDPAAQVAGAAEDSSHAASAMLLIPCQ
ncbi:hypothetical protein DUNSADRAFT_17620 [Dunaliella salina]|uniref:IQ calmodulin-binding motif domain-containing protein n=1 Tax=Dunaliella salina TaxID=3046 RepID=A0ABQ7GZZ1_DUNSA|nr:hypothetical protein DUNSADRAFT_17620 [Dunaliella salina]|eukprot:KAF5840136.1 hypothetical protein DUNSADRAFT_17620 [Dunaliella salina]